MAAPNINQQANQRTQEQKRAESAWNCVSTVKNWPENKNKEKKEFRSLARGAAADIQINGLGQTLAFWKAKGGDGHMLIYNAVSDWIRGPHNDLLTWIRHTQTSTDDYRRATTEAIAYLIWIKRFAEAELPKE